jgi:tmRNA-binding protein
MSDIVSNSKARRDYHILDVIEAGICLRGTEIKSFAMGALKLTMHLPV